VGADLAASGWFCTECSDFSHSVRRVARGVERWRAETTSGVCVVGTRVSSRGYYVGGTQLLLTEGLLRRLVERRSEQREGLSVTTRFVLWVAHTGVEVHSPAADGCWARGEELGVPGRCFDACCLRICLWSGYDH
jgi:hypothetical protein